MMNLDVDFGGLFFPHYGEKPIEHQRKINDDKFLKLRVGYYKLQPIGSADIIKEKRGVLDSVFEGIMKNITITIKT